MYIILHRTNTFSENKIVWSVGGGKVDGQILSGTSSEKPKILFGTRDEKRKNLFGTKWQFWKILYGSQRVKYMGNSYANIAIRSSRSRQSRLYPLSRCQGYQADLCNNSHTSLIWHRGLPVAKMFRDVILVLSDNSRSSIKYKTLMSNTLVL